MGTLFTYFIPSLPTLLPWLDIGVGLVVLTWILLLRYYCKTRWLHTFAVATIAAILYVVILAVISALVMLI